MVYKDSNKQSEDNSLGHTTPLPKEGDLVRILEVEETPKPYRDLTENDSQPIIDYQADTGATNTEVARILGVDHQTVARVKRYANFKDISSLLKAVGVQAGEVAVKSYALLNQKLDAQGDRLRPVELAGIATYASGVSHKHLSVADAVEEPESWDDLGEVEPGSDKP